MNKKQIQEISLLAQDYFLGHKGYNHYGCSLAIAEAFHFYTPAYHSLRRGGLTGEYRCGAIAAAELILGEIFGPIKADVQVDPKFLKIILIFRKQLARKLPRLKKNFICNDLIKGFKDFNSLSRLHFCGQIVKKTAVTLAETIEKFGGESRMKII